MIAGLLGAAGTSQAQGLYSLSPFDREDGYLTFYFDNDLFGGDDKESGFPGSRTTGRLAGWASSAISAGCRGTRTAMVFSGR